MRESAYGRQEAAAVRREDHGGTRVLRRPAEGRITARPVLMPSTHKKVVVRKMDRDSINGYVAPANFVRE